MTIIFYLWFRRRRRINSLAVTTYKVIDWILNDIVQNKKVVLSPELPPYIMDIECTWSMLSSLSFLTGVMSQCPFETKRPFASSASTRPNGRRTTGNLTQERSASVGTQSILRTLFKRWSKALGFNGRIKQKYNLRLIVTCWKLYVGSKCVINNAVEVNCMLWFCPQV